MLPALAGDDTLVHRLVCAQTTAIRDIGGLFKDLILLQVATKLDHVQGELVGHGQKTAIHVVSTVHSKR